MDPSVAAGNALKYVLGAETGEKIVIICDDERADIGKAFAQGALLQGLWTKLVLLPRPGKNEVRTNPDDHVKELLTRNDVDIFINLLRGAAGETPFRIKIITMETRKRRRLGHCPGITMDMLTTGALALSSAEYAKMQGFADKLMGILRGAEKVHLTDTGGTNLTFSVIHREFFTDTYVDFKTMKWMNLPVGEVIVGPVEDSLNGTLVCRGAVGGVGRIKGSVAITARKGKAVDVKHANKKVLKSIKTALATDRMSSFVGEFAFGINPHAGMVKEFLEIEKIRGTVHIAFGHNMDFPGGKNNARNHMDFLMTTPTVDVTYANGRTRNIMEKGKFTV